MNELIKIKNLCGRYGVSARTLRYYEDMGLIESIRTDGYAYRMYNAAAVKRLEQILILRRLNIGIKDIRRVFAASGSDAVLDVLGKKVADIDEEVALLHELKEIVIAFIRQIEKADFTSSSDVKLLYDKAREIETHIASADYRGNASPAHRLFEVADRLEEKAARRLQIPENIFKRLLQNVYFIWGGNEGIAVADELGRKYGFFVYHTCDYRHIHHKNSDPVFQPELSRDVPDFFALDPQEAMQRESGVVHDFTPMVIMDLIQLAAKHDGVICENSIEEESIIHLVTNAAEIVNVSGGEGNNNGMDRFIKNYENAIRGRDIPADEKERLVRKVSEVWKKEEQCGDGDFNTQGKNSAGVPVQGRNSAGVPVQGIKRFFVGDNFSAEQTAADIAEYFGLPCV